MTTRSLCNSCNAEIVWVRTEAGKLMPIEPAPTADGNVIRTGPQTVRVLAKGEDYQGLRYRAHHVRCPNAAQHRRTG